MVKMYINDPDNIIPVPYKQTSISAIRTKGDIDRILAKWQVKDIAWRWDPDNNDVFVTFQIIEEIDGKTVAPVVKIEPPRLWNKASTRGKHRKDSINWKVSLRVMFWYIKTHLEKAYLTQSSKTTEFLPHIVIPKLDDKTLKDVLVPNLDEQLKALPTMEKIYPNLDLEDQS